MELGWHNRSLKFVPAVKNAADAASLRGLIQALGIRGFSWNSRKLKRYALMQR